MIIRFIRLIFSLLSLCQFVFSQPAYKNTAPDSALIPNGSFERYLNLPEEENNFYGYIQNWDVNASKKSPFLRSPSFLHQHKYSRENKVQPHSGYGMASIEFNWQSAERSYLQTKLSKALIPGKRYQFSFWVMLDNTANCQDVFPELGFLFTVKDVEPDTNYLLPSKPHWYMMHPLETTQWQKVQVIFTPQLPYQYLSVGSFLDISDIALAKRPTCSRIILDDYNLIEVQNTDNFDFFSTVSVPGGNLGGIVSVDRPDLLSIPSEDIRIVKPIPVPGRPGNISLRGRVLDASTQKPIVNSKIIVLAQPHDSVIIETKTNVAREVEGSYKLEIPKYKQKTTYYIIASKSNYYFSDTTIIPTDTTSDEKISHTFYLKRLKEEEPIQLKNIHFQSSEAILTPESFPELDKLVWLLGEKPRTQVLVAGHTDDQGDEKFNTILSEKRAQAVVEYLVSKGIAESRLQFKGYGKTKPIASNQTPEGRSKNRRVEIILSEQQ
ncbi:MAG: OmpA family protein [Bacteroidia bacterium]|nr:OmpA family protein [Bacteroidia bacterium]